MTELRFVLSGRVITIKIPSEGTVIEIRHTHTKPDGSEQIKEYRLHANKNGIHI